MRFTSTEKPGQKPGGLALFDGFKLPIGRISGRTLGALVTAVRRTPARGPLTQKLRVDLGIERARALGREARGPLPQTMAPLRARSRAEQARGSLELGPPTHAGLPRSAASLHAAYARGGASPVDVARSALAAARSLSNQSPTLGSLCAYDDEVALAAAAESAARFFEGRVRSPLEGVPVAIKEEVNQRGIRARLGTSFLGHDASTLDAEPVRRLREAGAVIIGQTPMTELGLSPLGANPHRRMPRNPHDRSRLAGGSSTGSAVAVATGITPVSLGCDGGGSIRIPAALCGVFGLKPSYGRVPNVGLGMPGATSVVHMGPLGVSSSELAAFLEIASGPHPDDVLSGLEPAFEPGDLLRALGRGVSGLSIGIDENEWAAAPSDLSKPCRAALAELEKQGARLVSIRIPTAAHAAAIGYLTIGLEAFSALAEVRARNMDELGPDLQLSLTGMETFRPDDYLDAQRLRQGLRRDVQAILRDVDLIALPTTARGAPQVTDEEALYGFVDPPLLDGICRYAFLANLTGLPAGEACVLQAIAALERCGAARAIPSDATIDLLG